MHRRSIVVRIVSRRYNGQLETLPMVWCDSSGDNEILLVLRRWQYPVKHAWAITLNKSQGQTIGEGLGIYLPAPVFSHEQLYVSMSRATSFAGARVLVSGNDSDNLRCRNTDGNCAHYTLNIIDKDLLASASTAEVTVNLTL